MPRGLNPLRILDFLPVRHTRGLQGALTDRRNLASELSIQTAGRIQLEIDSLPKGALSIEDSYDEALNSPYILAKVRTAEAEHFSAVIIDCFGDPDPATRKRLTAKGLHVPIVEPLRAAVYTAVAWTLGGITHSKETFMSPRAKRRAVDFPT